MVHELLKFLEFKKQLVEQCAGELQTRIEMLSAKTKHLSELASKIFEMQKSIQDPNVQRMWKLEIVYLTKKLHKMQSKLSHKEGLLAILQEEHDILQSAIERLSSSLRQASPVRTLRSQDDLTAGLLSALMKRRASSSASGPSPLSSYFQTLGL